MYLVTKAQASLNLTEKDTPTLNGEEAQWILRLRHTGEHQIGAMIPDLRGITLAQLARQAADR